MDSQILQYFMRLLLALVVGMALGFEREWREKAAGFRTLALVSLGACAFVLSTEALLPGEAARIAAGVVTGIGFLGAGAIMREHGEVLGLTTAATVWVAAALGISAALGQWFLTLAGLALALLVLLLFPLVDITTLVRDARHYEIDYGSTRWDEEALGRELRSAGLRASPQRVVTSSGGTTVVWLATGRPSRHAAAMEELVANPSIVSVSVY